MLKTEESNHPINFDDVKEVAYQTVWQNDATLKDPQEAFNKTVNKLIMLDFDEIEVISAYPLLGVMFYKYKDNIKIG